MDKPNTMTGANNLAVRVYRYFMYLGFWRGLGLMLHRLVGRFLSPHSESTWASLGEDILLKHIINEVLDIRAPGYYVDVGCNDPIIHSNTYKLYQSGWRGIAIDANKALIERYKKIRQRDVAICSLVSDITEELQFTNFRQPLFSSVETTYVKEWGQVFMVESVTTMKPARLDEILDRHEVPKCFELLKVDVEGHDLHVLNSLDFEKYRPRIILVEMDARTVESAIGDPIFIFLKERGYLMHSLAGYNGIFLKNEGVA